MHLGVVYFAILWTLFIAGNASHFRGGTASWKHLGSVGYTHEIELNFRLGWRRDYFTPICDDDRIADQQLGYDEGNWMTQLGSQNFYFDYSDDNGSGDYPVPVGVQPNGNVFSTATKCTSYDPDENWAYGYNSARINITTAQPFTIKFAGGDWISTLYFGANGKWSLALIDIDLDIRNDTGLVNHPPSTFSPPVVRLQLGCPETIEISTVDQDNDIVSCRYAVGSLECEGICGQYPHFSLDSKSCTIAYDGGGSDYLIPVALMISDSPRQSVAMGRVGRLITPSDYFSQIPLQFLVKVETTSGCNVVPTYPTYAIPEDKVFTIPEQGTFNETLYAYPSSTSVAITRFIILGPLGLQNSPVYDFKNNVYATNISWTPTPDQAGKHSICYYAIDGAKTHGKQRCFEVGVSVIRNACEVDNGGCNDLCVRSGQASKCVCTKPCWSLAVDGKTCIPNMKASCSGESIDISVAACSTNATVVAGASVSSFDQKTCQSKNQGSYHQLKLSPLECNVTIQSNPVEVQYITNIWIWEGKTYGHGRSTITRGQWLRIPVSCSLPASSNVTGSFVPIHPFDDEFIPENIAIEGLGNFTFYFEFYRESNFKSAYGPLDLPLEVTVNDDIYFSLGAVGRGGLVFFTEECVAQSTPNLTPDTLQYTFIENGCLLDPTAVRYESPNAMENRFSMKAFDFKNKLVVNKRDANIYIQCKVMLCDAGNNNTRCSELCLSNRPKRSVQSDENILIREVRHVDENDQSLSKPSLLESPLQDVTSRIRIITDSDKSDDSNEARINHSCLILLKVGVILSSIRWWFGN